MALVFVNGELLAEPDARISVFDHGLVVGDGVFETILVRNGRPFALRRHLERLERSALGLGLGPPDRVTIAKAIDAVLASDDLRATRVRVTVTAGPGSLGSHRSPLPATLIVAAAAQGCAAPRTTGPPGVASAAVVVVPWTRNERGALAGLKTISYAENALALAWAEARGGDEAVFANGIGNLCEGSGSNVFVVRDGELFTPPLTAGCLAGVTRDLVLERLGGRELDLAIDSFHPSELDEAFLVSTIRAVQPIASIDGHQFGGGAPPGPVTASIASALAELVASEDDP